MILSALSVSALLYLVLLPAAVIHLLAVLLLPCLLSPGAKASACAKAAYCYLMQIVGVILMTIGALPAVYGVFEKFALGVERFSAEMYLALLILFSAGGFVFLWHERVAERIEDASKKIPALLFWYTFKIIGMLLMLASALHLVLVMLLTGAQLVAGWWITSSVLLLYGALLSWCTRTPVKMSPPAAFTPAPMGKKRR